MLDMKKAMLLLSAERLKRRSSPRDSSKAGANSVAENVDEGPMHGKSGAATEEVFPELLRPRRGFCEQFFVKSGQEVIIWHERGRLASDE